MVFSERIDQMPESAATLRSPSTQSMNVCLPSLIASAGSGASSAAVRVCRWVVLLLICAVFCFATRGTGLGAQKTSIFARGSAAAHFAIADFDGDNRPDLATVETGLIGASHARYWIGFRMSAGARQMIGVNGPVGGLEIASRDVNGDNIIDLVVSAAWLKSPVAVLVNDGHGNFTVRDPAAFSIALTNPDWTFGSPNQDNAPGPIALTVRGSSDFMATGRAAANRVTSEKFTTRNSLPNAFLLAVCSSGRAPPLIVHHV